jgi:uncharacterized repeat protein (TIGR03943 family)
MRYHWRKFSQPLDGSFCMTSVRNRLQLSPNQIALIDIAAIGAWGILLLEYWLNQKLTLLIHPNYITLSVVTGFMLLAIAAYRIWTLVQLRRTKQKLPVVEHLSILPPGMGSVLLLGVAILGLVITPKAFASQTALQRGVGEITTLSQIKPQSFRVTVKPEERTIIDWMRTLQVSPEPDNYKGQKVRVQGFVVQPKELSAQYFRVTRFIVTCCAADAYPVSFPVKLTEGDRTAYAADTWLEIEGTMITETLENKRQLVIQSRQIKPIAQPKNPYDY